MSSSALPNADRVDALLAELRAATTPTVCVLPELDRTPRSVALVAGSFDPMTVAHAALTEAARDTAELALLVYSARALPKGRQAPPPVLSETAKVESLLRFAADRDGVAVGLCSHGLIAEQVEAARRRFPGAELSVVVGSDKVMQLFDPAWYDDRNGVLTSMFSTVRVLYAVRAGEEHLVERALSDPQNARWKHRFHRLALPPGVAAVSSSAVRELVREGKDVSTLVPPEALEVLSAHSE